LDVFDREPMTCSVSSRGAGADVGFDCERVEIPD